ncbi:DMT family transporter [Tropicibacter sp. R15_0]|uniref:DMT family transporter n=1 Tax=Tropicibacter sp. R15_0 TaxID=2821101 RepID=UPI001ADBEB63|nr:DMT family transporter [Tropicibacter sp. R15_0]MBO9464188.1 DMT family transporter [Tropicibacter sp. R15_0]
MKLFLLTTLTMVAFAANSLLTRAGVFGAGLDTESFAMLRLMSGAFALMALCRLNGIRIQGFGWKRVVSVFGLALYIIGFTDAYLVMDAGIGALLLFGTVQVTMFLGAVLARETLPPLRIVGSALAFGGLVYLVWPWQDISRYPIGVLMMIAAGIGWGIYSLAGRGSAAPLADTAANFLLACLVVPLVFWAMGADMPMLAARAENWAGIGYAVASGAVASGLGYALWFHVLPQLQASIAAVAQLTVPPIAMAGGMLFLGEALTLKFTIASVVILGGVALSVLGPRYLVKSSNAS